MLYNLQVSEANEIPITALKPFKKIEKKLKYIFMTILGLTKSFKTMNRPVPIRLDANRP